MDKRYFSRIYQHTKGFTLIELLLVMALIGTLVTVSAPNYLNQNKRGKEIEIRNSVMMIESKVGEYRLLNALDAEVWHTVDIAPVEGVDDSLYLYNRDGRVHDNDASSDTAYRRIPDDFLTSEFNLYLEGTFLMDEEGRVYYSRNTLP